MATLSVFSWPLTPIKIINPLAIRVGNYPMPSVRSPLTCETSARAEQNALCTMDSELAARFLVGAQDPSLPLVFKGRVTEHCMNVSATTFSRYASFTDDAGRSHDVWRETRLTVSGPLKWRD